MSVVQPIKRYTPQEYYRLEREADYKSDYYNGEIFNMSGGTSRHSLISANIVGELRQRLKGKPCKAYDASLRLRVLSNGLRCYPDGSIFCEKLQYDPEDDGIETATNPSVLFEVLSKSTEAYDRGFKSGSYREIESLKAYSLVSQTVARVETYTRLLDGTWQFRETRGLDESVLLVPIGVELPMAEIYAGVDLGSTEPGDGKMPSDA